MKLKGKISTIYDDLEDLAAFTERNHEPDLDFEKVIADLECSKKINDSDQKRLTHKRKNVK